MGNLISPCQLTRQLKVDLESMKGILDLGRLLWLQAQRPPQEHGSLEDPLLQAEAGTCETRRHPPIWRNIPSLLLVHRRFL